MCAGRKHQLRKACANVLRAPIVGDGRYALLRSPEQRWFQERLQELPAVPEDRPEEALGSMLRCNRHLQLHCFQVSPVRVVDSKEKSEPLPAPDLHHSLLTRCLLLKYGTQWCTFQILLMHRARKSVSMHHHALQLRVRDAEGFLVEATAPLPAHMRNAIRMLFRSLPEDLDAALAKMVQLTDFSSPQFLQQALAAANSLAPRAGSAPSQPRPQGSPALPRSSHVELPADPKFQHLCVPEHCRESRNVRSRQGRRRRVKVVSQTATVSPEPWKARWTNAEKREAKEGAESRQESTA